MENRNVKTFVTIVEFNSFTKAADYMGYSQAAVTAHIKALEKELGVPLFDRVGKHIYLTQEGKKFLPYARNLIKAEEEAKHSIRSKEKLSGELRICSASSIAMGVLPELLLRFLEQNPEVKVVVKVSDYLEDTVSRVERGEIDFLACLDETGNAGDFITFARKKQKLVFVTYPDNPLLNKKACSIEEVIRSSFLVSDIDIGYCASLDQALHKMGIVLEPVIDMSSVGAIINVLLGGYGVSYLPEFMVAKYIESGDLAILNVNGIDIDLYSYFICSKERWINPVMKEFMQFAEKQLCL